MQLEELEARNAETLRLLREGKGSVDPQQHPYHGYYTVDLFECPKFMMFTNNDCPRALDILFHREFEPQSMKIWCRLARTATGILDIGAHVGVYSLAAAALRNDIHIHSFEPNPHAYTRLRMHKTLNSFENIVEHWFAVANQDGQTTFSWVRKPSLLIASGGGLGKRKGDNVERINVQVHKLDGTSLPRMIGERPLVKIDVEGGEAAAMHGIHEILALNADILLETFSQESCDVINPILKSQGYNVFKIFERNGKTEPVDMLHPCITASGDFNHLITRRGADEIARLVA